MQNYGRGSVASESVVSVCLKCMCNLVLNVGALRRGKKWDCSIIVSRGWPRGGNINNIKLS